jgi:hypothetical protein
MTGKPEVIGSRIGIDALKLIEFRANLPGVADWQEIVVSTARQSE